MSLQDGGWLLVFDSVLCFVVGGALVWLLQGKAAEQLRAERDTARQQRADDSARLNAEKTELEKQLAAVEPERRQAADDKRELLEKRDEVQNLAGEVRELKAQLAAAHDASQADKARIEQLEAEAKKSADAHRAAMEKLAKLEEQQASLNKELAWLQEAEAKLSATFGNLASAALRRNNEDFGQRTSDLLKPLQERLGELHKAVSELEEKRAGAYAELGQQLTSLRAVNETLGKQTDQLRQALRGDTRQRAQWGEFTLLRVVELAGMQPHVDFVAQETGDEGRPDMVVRLPGRGAVIVDAKAPMTAYLRAVEATTDEERAAGYREHANAVRAHVRSLASKAYWQRQESAEFVVLFLPNDAVLSAALEADLDLLEFALNQRVALAAPSSLFALLKAVAYGWQQHLVTTNAQQIIGQVAELQKRLGVFLGHFDDVGKHLGKASEAYNSTLRSYQSRLQPTVRRLEGLSEASQSLPEPTGIEVLPQIGLLVDEATDSTRAKVTEA